MSAPASQPAAQATDHARAFNAIALAMRDIKLAHTVFALPFAVFAAFLATPATSDASPAGAWGTFAGQLALVVVCMVFARTWAMLVNRIADRRFDAANERTARRAVASGALPVRAAVFVAAAAAVAFVVACSLFWAFYGNPWPAALALPTLAFLAFYSFTKRFTALCHLYLGAALAFSPVAAAIAVRPAALGDMPAVWLLSAMVAAWVAGFDVLYALQDVDFDRSAGLRSAPARIGPGAAAGLSRVLHGIAAGCLVVAWLADRRLGGLFFGATVLVAGLLAFEHLWLARKGLPGLPITFGLVNGCVSVLLGAAGVVDALVG